MHGALAAPPPLPLLPLSAAPDRTCSPAPALAWTPWQAWTGGGARGPHPMRAMPSVALVPASVASPYHIASHHDALCGCAMRAAGVIPLVVLALQASYPGASAHATC